MTAPFKADPAFEAGSVLACDWPLCQVRLQDDARYPWLILIPRRAGLHEIEDLTAAERAALMDEVVRAGEMVREMGAAAGRFIAQRHPPGSPPVTIAWFPGPKGAGWVSFVEAGFKEAIANSSGEIVMTLFGDTGLEQQVLLVEEVLESMPDVDYLVGSGPMAEA